MSDELPVGSVGAFTCVACGEKTNSGKTIEDEGFFCAPCLVAVYDRAFERYRNYASKPLELTAKVIKAKHLADKYDKIFEETRKKLNERNS